MVVELPALLTPLPSTSSEAAKPVARRTTVGTGFRPQLPIRLRIVARGAAFCEPGVLIGGMIGDKVENEPDARIMQGT